MVDGEFGSGSDSDTSASESNDGDETDKYDHFIADFFRRILVGTNRTVRAFAYQAIRANPSLFGLVFECFNSCDETENDVVLPFYSNLQIELLKTFFNNILKFSPNLAWTASSYFYNRCCILRRKNTVEEYYADRLINVAVKDLKEKGVILTMRPLADMEKTTAFGAIKEESREILRRKFDDKKSLQDKKGEKRNRA